MSDRGGEEYPPGHRLAPTAEARITGRPGREDWYKLSAAQVEFLRAMIGTTKALSTLMRELQIRPQTLGKWMESPYFKRRFDECVRFVSKRRRAEIELTAARAASEMAQIVDDPPTDRFTSDRMTTLHIAVQAPEEMAVRRQRCRRARRKANELAIEPPNPVHPSVTDEEAEELLARLEGRSAAEGGSPNDENQMANE